MLQAIFVRPKNVDQKGPSETVPLSSRTEDQVWRVSAPLSSVIGDQIYTTKPRQQIAKLSGVHPLIESQHWLGHPVACRLGWLPGLDHRDICLIMTSPNIFCITRHVTFLSIGRTLQNSFCVRQGTSSEYHSKTDLDIPSPEIVSWEGQNEQHAHKSIFN